MKKSKKIIIAVVIVLVIAVCGGVAWYKLYKAPHDAAIASFNKAASVVEKKNDELDESIKDLKKVMDSGEKPYDENTITTATTTIAAAQEAEEKVPDMPSSTDDINKTVKKINTNIDYSDQIAAVKKAQTDLENSIQSLKQITNPAESFVITRLQNVPGITGIQAVTEDNDPNGSLGKSGGYTASVYFTYDKVDQSQLYTSGRGDIVDKGNEGGGDVEVYANVDDANKRNDYLGSLDGVGLASPGSHTVAGTCVVRTSDQLPASKQNELTQNIINALTTIE